MEERSVLRVDTDQEEFLSTTVVVVMTVFTMVLETSSTFLNHTSTMGVSGSSSSKFPSYKSSVMSSNRVTHLEQVLGLATSEKICLSKLTLPEMRGLTLLLVY